MVLVDTSVWVSHLRDGNADLANLLNDGRVLCHPLIVGELACGNFKDRASHPFVFAIAADEYRSRT